MNRGVSLAAYTRFGIGGPADYFVEAPTAPALAEAIRNAGANWIVIGGGSNLVVSDSGHRGTCIRFTGNSIQARGTLVTAEAGVDLQALVDFTVERGLKGLETMTGIPGSVGGAVYGNAGAYGHSIMERVKSVQFLEDGEVREIGNAGCEFHYRESIFKKRKDRIIVSTTLEMEIGDAAELKATADRILTTRNKKYPPTMRCAGSIFKNFLFAELPPAVAAQVPSNVVIEGKVPAAWFLEQAGAKGMKRGGIEVADYHANLIYNAGGGTAEEVVEIIDELKARVRERWGIEIQEEVQFVGSFTARR